MKTIFIKYFKDKHQDRITFVRILVEYNSDLGLKRAKEKMDNMFDGIPIEYKVADNRLDDFLKELNSLKLEYEIK